MPRRLLGRAALFAMLALASLPLRAQDAEHAPRADQNVPGDLKPGDAFGEPTVLAEKTIIYVKGSASWDNALPALVSAFKTLNQYLQKQGIAPAGAPMTIYTSTDDKGFAFDAALPIAQAPKEPPTGNIAVGKSPAGKALKFVHRGSYDAMDSTYEAIANYLDDKQLEAKNLFIEEYLSDLEKSDPDHLVVNVYVPVN
ncbi:MAG TPA: GyrI-like domain-containing protein [Pseudolabrys sp.]|nr:GyrI-like domain-containing protein [Pseudolabrys sp.]